MTYIDEHNRIVDNVRQLISDKEFDAAADFLRPEVDRDPDNQSFLYFYFVILIRLKRYEEAKPWLKKVVSYHEERSKDQWYSYHPSYLYYSGLYHFINGNIKRSMEFFEKCFRGTIHYLSQILRDETFNIVVESFEFQELIKPKRVVNIDEHITLKLILDKTLIYVCGGLFLTCQKIVLTLAPTDFKDYEGFTGIDDILEFYHAEGRPLEVKENKLSITPEEEFWAHCSNMQAWVESGYNTHVLSKHISFPILARLSKKGISQFILLLKEELIDRLKSGGYKTLVHFIDSKYLDFLSQHELFDLLLSYEEAEIMKEVAKYSRYEYTLTAGSLHDSRTFISLRTENKVHFCFEDNHVVELEILVDDSKLPSDKVYSLLHKVKGLNYLKELAVYGHFKGIGGAKDLFEGVNVEFSPTGREFWGFPWG